MSKKTLWLFMSDLTHEDIHLAIPSVAWMAKEAGAQFECYLESERNGQLFARTGSTILGGHHHQQFNYLNAVFTVKYIFYGEPLVFRSSVNVFDAEVIVETDCLIDLYSKLLAYSGQKPQNILFSSESIQMINTKELEIGPYIYPEIFFRKALAFPFELQATTKNTFCNGIKLEVFSVFLSRARREWRLRNGDWFWGGATTARRAT